nr:MAG TPA: hypothetical protein [Caudoviricetes sp.]
MKIRKRVGPVTEGRKEIFWLILRTSRPSGRRRWRGQSRSCRSTRSARRRWTNGWWTTSCGSGWGTGKIIRTP